MITLINNLNKAKDQGKAKLRIVGRDDLDKSVYIAEISIDKILNKNKNKLSQLYVKSISNAMSTSGTENITIHYV
jgi:hypothetical protein